MIKKICTKKFIYIENRLDFFLQWIFNKVNKQSKEVVNSNEDIIEILSEHIVIFRNIELCHQQNSIGIIDKDIELFFLLIKENLSLHTKLRVSSNPHDMLYITNKAYKYIKQSKSSFTIEGKKILLNVFIWAGDNNIYPQDPSIKLMCKSNKTLARTISNEDFPEKKIPEKGNVSLLNLYPCPVCTRINFPIDVVYSWVNYEDDGWQNLISRYENINNINKGLYYNFNELKYSLRSIYMYAPWVRKIFILTNCARPEWIKKDKKIEWVEHDEIFHQEHRPCFNSHVIASYLGEIPKLSEHFIYFNDDAFLGRPVQQNQFFTSNGCSISHMGSALVRSKCADSAQAYLKAAVNGRKLLEERFGVSCPLQHIHIPSAICKKTFLDMTREFNNAFFQFRKNKFRSDSDISSVAYLYHNYAYIKKETIFSDKRCSHILIQERNFRRAPFSSKDYDFIGLNDGGNGNLNEEYIRWKIAYMKKNFSAVPYWEKESIE